MLYINKYDGMKRNNQIAELLQRAIHVSLNALEPMLAVARKR
jgi:hypothetical protein